MTDTPASSLRAGPALIGMVEDDPHLRDYLCEVIASDPGLKVVFAEGTVAGAMRRFEDGPIDLCLVDLQLPDGTGTDLVRHLKARGGTKCLILTVLGDRTSVIAALDSGADGYLLKDSEPTSLVGAIKSTLAGFSPISPQAALFLLELYQRNTPQVGGVCSDSTLTVREQDVLKLFSRGLSYREASQVLEISEHTIRDHVKAIYRKLSVHSRSEAIFEARQLGIISSGD